MFKLGVTVKDKITGFTGIVTGCVNYITGCNQVLVTPKMDKAGSFVAPVWLDEQRCVQVGKAIIKIDNSTSKGFDVAAPIR